MPQIPMRKVFISSTTADLGQYRQEAVQVIKELNDEYQGQFQLKQVTMDTEGQTGERETPVEVSKKWVNDSDWIVLIVAWNYGYVAADEERSVTEWEYRQSQELCQPPKTCFVYLAGESSDGEKKYRPLGVDREKADLADWKEVDRVPAKDRVRLKGFKEDLRKKRFELFSNLDDFRALLKHSLKTRIESELHPYNVNALLRNSHLQQVLIGLEEPIQRCIDEVKLLATLKRIHDRLHKIRQFGIRRWREEVLTQWHDGVLAGEAKVTFFKGLATVNEYRWRLDGFLLHIPDEAVMPTVPLKDLIQKVLDAQFCKESGAEPSDRKEFESATNRFAARVQNAFTSTNRTMLERASVLRCYYESLLTSFVSPPQPALTPKDDNWFKTELEALKERHESLQSVFGRHHDWQQMHDWLEQVDNFKGLSFFADELERFLDNHGKAMDPLLDDADRLAHASRDPMRQKRWQDNIDAVRKNFKTMEEHKDESSYERMRKVFDDLFYAVDVETLASVEASEKRVSEFDRGLKKQIDQVRSRLMESQTVPSS